jgi:cysteinyl-tRNA synthetase
MSKKVTTPHPLKMWNTASRSLEVFEPLHPPEVGIYNCGPTVYNPLTIGNLRAYTFVDVLKRTLLFLGYGVKHVMNITDVGHLAGDGDEGEDKMEREASRRGKNAWELARMYESLAVQDMDRLHLLRPDVMPRATDNIAEQIALVQTLEKKGFTYRTSDGVYFDTSKFPAYGHLSGQPLEEKEEGARVTANPEKKHPTDFALWKFSPTTAKRHMEWESPWGVGFPGWHIECSAMSVKYLGQPFDIHAGGIDLVPVHHENEIAQTEAATEKPLARYWIHNEFLTVDGRRMGKSEGNAYTLDDLIAKGFDPLAFRYYCLGTHYRSKMNFTWEGLEGAANALKSLQAETRHLSSGEADETFVARFTEVLADDLGTPQALAVVWDLLKSDLDPSIKGGTLAVFDQVLGLRLADMIGKTIEIPPEVLTLAEERQKARDMKDWKTSDELRDRIAERGWIIEDTKEGFELVAKK